MKIKLLLFLLFTSSLILTASTDRLATYPEVTQSAVQFSVRNAGLEVMGTIEGISAEIAFHPSDLEHSYITATALPATLRTGISIRDKHLQRVDYFNVKNHSQIRLVSKGFRKTGKSSFVGQFDVTIKNVTKEITFPFAVSPEENTTVYRGHFELNRLDFNLGEKSSILAEKVKVWVAVYVQDRF